MKAQLIPVVLFLLSVNTALAAKNMDKDILATRGEGVITQEDFSARADKIPANIRRSTLRNGNRLQDVLNSMLLNSQMAEAARNAGFDKSKIVQDRMRLAADRELGEAWVEHYIDLQPSADYEAMAKESFELNKDSMKTVPEIDVSHILISSKGRSKEEAMSIADDIEKQLEENPTRFDELVIKYSEDPSAASNKGHFKAIKKGDMVKQFEDVAFAMQVGEISLPVQTRYGLHIIRLDAVLPAASMSYEEVEEQLLDSMRSRHRERIKNNYLTELSNIDVSMTEEQLEIMVQRQFGEDYQVEPEGQ